MKQILLTSLLFIQAVTFIFSQQETNQRPSSGREKRIAFIQHERLLATSPYQEVKWKLLNPSNISGRSTDARGVPGDKKIIYAGFATGGLWKTVDSGKTWTPLMDRQPTQAIGNIAIAPSNPKVIYAGTGEANIFRASLPGLGVYKSTDGGNFWSHLGLENTATISRILIHPTDPNTVYVAAGGNEWSRNEDRGVYKSTDGGLNWKKILYVNDKTGANDLLMDPSDPNILYASMWTRIRKRWSDPVPEDGDHIYKSTDAGQTWKIINNGLPDTKETGRIGLANTPANPNVLYAFVDNHGKKRDPNPGEQDSYNRPKVVVIKGAEVYKSTDKGESWKRMSEHDDFMEFFSGTYGWVFAQIRVSPTDENKVYLMGLDLTMSADGGKTWKSLTKGPKGEWGRVHGDHHGLWIDPTDPNYLINANDGGVNVSYDGGTTWKGFYHEIPTTQFYNVTYDPRTPFYIYGSIQDEGSVRMLSTTTYDPADRTTGKFDWVPGGEGTRIAIDQKEPDIIYSSSYYGHIMKGNLKRLGKKGASESIDPPVTLLGEEHRGEWLAATIISPHDGTTLYHGLQYVLKTTDKGKTWEKISPDLTQNNRNKIGTLPYRINFQTISALAESPKKKGLLYAGTDDGKAHFTTAEGTGKWTEIGKGLLEHAAVSSIEPSRFEDATVYLSQSDRREDNIMPLVFKSMDYGRNWTKIESNLPASPVNIIREDPDNKDILYAGTDMGIYRSTDGAKTWNAMHGNLPASVSVQDLFIHPTTKQIVIATYGRGVWILDRPQN